jgi:hypothetical protein
VDKEEGEEHEGCGGTYKKLEYTEACRKAMVAARKEAKKCREDRDEIWCKLKEAERKISAIRYGIKLIMKEGEE